MSTLFRWVMLFSIVGLAGAARAARAPLPAPFTYQEQTSTVGVLQVRVRTLARYDWPMVPPQLILDITNVGAASVSNLAMFTHVKESGLEIAAQPPRLYLAPNVTQHIIVPLDQAQNLDQLPFGNSTVTLQFTFTNQGTLEAPITVFNWAPYLTSAQQSVPSGSLMTVSGQVTDALGQPIDATIRLGVPAGNSAYRNTATATGAFSFTVPKSTRWVVTVTKAGYRSEFVFLDEARDYAGVTVALTRRTGLQLTYNAATTAERGNAFWAGNASGDGSFMFLSPGIETWPASMEPYRSQQKVMLYTTSGQKRWEQLTNSGNDAWGSDISPDGKWSVYVSHPALNTPDPNKVQSVVLLDNSDGHVVWQKALASFSSGEPSFPTDSQEVRFSPDGTGIAIGTGAGDLFYLRRTDGQLRWSQFLLDPIRSIRMSQDGASLYAISAARIARRVALADGHSLWSVTSESSWAHQTGIKESPDGTLLGIISQEGIITMHDAATGQIKWTWNPFSKGHWAGFSADSQVFVASTLAGTWGFDAKTGDRLFVIDGSSGGSFAAGQSYFVMPSSSSGVGVYDTTGTMISNPIVGLDWSSPNYYVGWVSSDLTRLAFAKNFITSPTDPVLFFASLAQSQTVTPSRIINLSVRTDVGTGDNALIAGFSLTGSGTKPLLIRGVGPTLAGFGVGNALADPLLEVAPLGGAVIAQNDNWGGTSELAAAFGPVGAFPLASATSKDAALLMSPAPGAYTAKITGASATVGNALAEVYDLGSGDNPKLSNVSARATVSAGDGVLTVGFVIGDGAPKKLLIRAVGPSLAAYGISGPLADPVLTVRPLGKDTVVASNDDWGGAAALKAVFSSVNAFPLASGDSKDAVVAVELPSGAYTAVISAKNGAAGIALLEVYEIP